MGGTWRLRPSRPAAAQSSRHHIPGDGDCAAWRIEIGLLDIQRNLQAVGLGELFLGGCQRDRLGETALSRFRHAESDVVAKVREARVLRGASREREAARAGILPLVLAGSEDSRARGAA